MSVSPSPSALAIIVATLKRCVFLALELSIIVEAMRLADLGLLKNDVILIARNDGVGS